jgi:hypothetical protein
MEMTEATAKTAIPACREAKSLLLLNEKHLDFAEGNDAAFGGFPGCVSITIKTR